MEPQGILVYCYLLFKPLYYLQASCTAEMLLVGVPLVIPVPAVGAVLARRPGWEGACHYRRRFKTLVHESGAGAMSMSSGFWNFD